MKRTRMSIVYCKMKQKQSKTSSVIDSFIYVDYFNTVYYFYVVLIITCTLTLFIFHVFIMNLQNIN
jgi:hypothetical protein